MPDTDKVDIILSIAFTLLAFFVLLVTIAIFMYLSKKKLVEQEMAMQQEVLNAVIQTQEQERSRISRDLHDDISSKLTAMSMHIYLLGREDVAASERSELAESIFGSCRQLIESTRRISHDLMPPTLDNMGLHLAIRELCHDFSLSGTVHMRYNNPGEQAFFEGLGKDREIHLFRIIQELVNNSLKHGKATEIDLVFSHAGKSPQMTYRDNGSGMTSQQLSQRKGIGLKNIFSRSGILQAKAHIDTHYGKGFYFTLTFNENYGCREE